MVAELSVTTTTSVFLIVGGTRVFKVRTKLAASSQEMWSAVATSGGDSKL